MGSPSKRVLYLALVLLLVAPYAIAITNYIKVNTLEAELAKYESLTEEQAWIIDAMKSKNEEVSAQLFEGNQKLVDYEAKLSRYAKQHSDKCVNDSGFRSWMSYRAISKNSKQGSIVSKASANKYGILEIENCVCVAVGTGWGLSLGDTATVITDSTSYRIIVSDIKSNAHTDSSCKVTVANGCAVEFIVNTDKLDSQIKISGNVATVPEYAGKVMSIDKD